MFRGIGVDPDDNLFVGDSWNNRVQKFDSSGSFRMMFGSYGNGPGQFGGAGPNGLAFDADGHIYVSDTPTPIWAETTGFRNSITAAVS